MLPAPPVVPAVRARRAGGRPPFALAAALAVAIAACSGERGSPVVAADEPDGGTVVVATAAEPNTLLPPLASGTQSQAVVAQIFDRLAEIGDSLNPVGDAGFQPRLARSWAWADDSMSIAFRIDPKARWHDGTPVRSADVRFSFDVYTDPAVGSQFAPLLSNIDSVATPDSMTAVFWYKRRSGQQFFDATYPLYVVPAHLLKDVPRAELASAPFGRRPVGTGRFRFGRWDAGQRVELLADVDNYRGRPMLNRVVFGMAPDFGAAVIKLVSGEADFFESVRPENIGQLARNRALRLQPYPSLDYGFLQFNTRAGDGTRRAHPVFGDREVRRALTMAVDRQRLVENVFDSLAFVALGPVPRALFADAGRIRQIPHDAVRARQILDSLGWQDSDGDGIRNKGSVPLAFKVLVPASSATRQRMAVLLQEQFRVLGVRMEIEPLAINEFIQRASSRRFDAMMGAWHTDPSPGGLRQTWGSAGSRARNGSNYGAYESRAFDVAVDSALAALDPARARAHWLRAYQQIVDDAPAIWLYEPRLVAALHRRIRPVRLRADGWWAGLAEWTIPPAERIARDRVGIR